jgi:hypothetical protein
MNFIEEISSPAVLAARIKQLKTAKKTLKGNLTRQKNFIRKFSEEPGNVNLFEVEERMSDINIYLNQFKDIVQHLNVYLTDEQEIEELDQEVEVFEEQYFQVKGEFADTIKMKKGSSSNGGSNNNGDGSKVSGPSKPSFRFPEIKIPIFEGKIEKWTHFRNLFEAVVIKEINLEPALKVQYLLSHIHEDIARSFSNIEYSQAGFDAIWNELKERYDNKQALIDHHLSELFQQKFVQKDCASDLRKLIDGFSINLNQLQILGQETDKWDTIIIHMVKFGGHKTNMAIKIHRLANFHWSK